MTGFIPALEMQNTLCLEIFKFKLWLSKNNQPKIVQNIENKFLGSFKIIKLQASAIKEVKEEIITNIAYKKQKWLGKKAAHQVMEITTFYKKKSNQKKKQ